MQAIQDLKEPSNVTELQSFLGLVTYLAPYIPNLSEQTSPLRMLLLKDSEFQWNHVHRQAFHKIKQLICEATALPYFDPAKHTVIQVDASKKSTRSSTYSRRMSHCFCIQKF